MSEDMFEIPEGKTQEEEEAGYRLYWEKRDYRHTCANIVYKLGTGCVSAGVFLGVTAIGGLAGYLGAQLLDPSMIGADQKIGRLSFDVAGVSLGVMWGALFGFEAVQKVYERFIELQWGKFKEKYVPDKTFAYPVESLDEVVDETTDTASS